MYDEDTLYVYSYSEFDEDYVFMETKYELKDVKKLERENQQLKEQLKQKEALIKKIENIFDDPNNSFSDGCDCRKIEKLLDNKGE